MSDWILRPAVNNDLDDLATLWAEVFGDPPEFIRAMLTDAKLTECAQCAQADGCVQSAMFAFEGISLGGAKAAYLYALATRESARGRGIGSAVLLSLIRRCFSAGAEIVFLSPASASLADWYRKIAGMQPMAAFADRPQLLTRGTARCTPVSAAAFAAQRQSPVGLSPQLVSAQGVVQRHFGGGFLQIEIRGETAYACAEKTDSGILIRELFCPEALRRIVCGAIADHFGDSRLFLRTSVGVGANLVYIKNDASDTDYLNKPENTAFFYTFD